MDDKINVCAYCRVSTNKKDQENSFDNQKYYFEREINNNSNYNLVNIYADKGISATSMNKREQFKQMVTDAGIEIKEHNYVYEKKGKKENYYILSERKPDFNRILVKNTSRFARNIDVIDLLRKLRSVGVYVDFLDIGKTTENESDFILIEMVLIFDENESRDKSRKVQFGLQEGMKRKVIMVNDKIFGYRKVNKFKLDIDEEQAMIVRIIFEKYAEGLGYRRIINYLDQNGYKTNTGKSFVSSTINKILCNEKYKGWLVRNKYTTGTIFVDKVSTPKLKPKEDWIIYKSDESGIPPIVSEELWDKCNQLKVSKINHKENNGIYRGKSDYAGLLICGECGHTYTRNIDKGRVFLNCGLKKIKGTKICNNINISLEKLEGIIEFVIDGEYYNHVASNIAFIEYEIDKLIYENKVRLKQDVNLKRLTKLEKELTKIKSKEVKVLEYIEDGRISKDVINDKLDTLDKKKQKIIKEMDELNLSKGELKKIIHEYERDKESLYELNLTKKISKSQFMDNIEKIKIYRGNKELHFIEDYKTVVIKFEFKNFVLPYKIGIKENNSYLLYN